MKRLALILPLLALAAAPARAEDPATNAVPRVHGAAVDNEPFSVENYCAVCDATARAQRLFLLGDFEGALAVSSNLLALSTGQEGNAVGEAAALNNIAWALHRMGRDAEALEPAQRSVERMTVASNLDTLACILSVLGETDEAKEKLGEAFRLLEIESAQRRSFGRRGKKASARGRSLDLLEKKRNVQFHLAQVLDLAGESALAKAMLNNLRIADFVPLGEEAAYDALADRLGAVPLEPEARERAAIRRVAALVAAACEEGNHADTAEAIHETFASIDASAVPDDVRAAVEVFAKLVDEGRVLVERGNADPTEQDETLRKELEDFTARIDRAGKDLMRTIRRHGVSDDVLRYALFHAANPHPATNAPAASEPHAENAEPHAESADGSKEPAP